jgi:hypothetical protein
VNGHWGYTGYTSPYTGDLSSDPKQLEQQLSHIFELGAHWKALLLLDEADVYLRGSLKPILKGQARSIV